MDCESEAVNVGEYVYGSGACCGTETVGCWVWGGIGNRMLYRLVGRLPSHDNVYKVEQSGVEQSKLKRDSYLNSFSLFWFEGSERYYRHQIYKIDLQTWIYKVYRRRAR